MEISPKDDVTFRFIPGGNFYPGTVVSVDETSLVLRSYRQLPRDLAAGWYLLIPEAPFSDVEIYAEVQEIRADMLSLRRVWMGRRASLRVDDVFPVSAHKVSGDAQFRSPRIVAPQGVPPPAPDMSEGSLSRQVWGMLEHINANVEFMLEKMCLERNGGSSETAVPSNISASGIKLMVQEQVEAGDIMEIKMLLPVYPPVVFIINGDLVWTADLGSGSRAAALRFMSMDDTTTDKILQYTFKRQRELNQKQREQE